MVSRKAYAKINLFLNVLDKRKDGYHNLEMINAKVDMYDAIEIKKCQISTGIIIKSNDLFLSNQDNIVLQCARYLQDLYHIDYGIEITIDKQIPYGAGLGGNSSDAAAVIDGINELAELNLTLVEMKEIGVLFGADIPYCLMNDVAYVSKIGEEIQIIENNLKGKNILLIHPYQHILTADVFKQADQDGYIKHSVTEMKTAIETDDFELIQQLMFNSLESVVLKNNQDMMDFKAILVDEIGEKGLVMTGSGSTYIKLFDKENDKIKGFINKNKENFLIKTCKIV